MLSGFDYLSTKKQSLKEIEGNPELYQQLKTEELLESEINRAEALSETFLDENKVDLWTSTFNEIEMFRSSGKSVALPPNPFYHRITLTTYDKIKIAICSIVLLPIRAILVTISLVLAWAAAGLGTLGLTLEKLGSEPRLSTPRRLLRWITARIFVRAAFFFAGFYWAKSKGHRASAKEAPIVLVVSHTSIFDSLPLIMLGTPTVVAKSEVHQIPIIGKLVDLTQPIYVRRENPSSRHIAIKEIARRAQSPVEWPQILIFPEGTCTNHTCLAKFKIGAFYPGVPIQPVVVNWPNRCNTTIWTFDGIPAWKVLLYTFSQFINFFEIEFLPVYHPDEDEQEDPKLYASNMECYLSKAMGIPATDYEYEHGCQLVEMRNSELPSRLINVEKLHSKLQSQMRTSEVEIAREALKKEMKWVADPNQVARQFGLDKANEEVQELFAIYDRNNTGTVDLREYFTHVFLLNPGIPRDKISMIIFMLYGQNRLLDRETLFSVLKNLFFISEGKAEVMMQKANAENVERIDLTCFEQIMGKRLDFVKLFAMEACGEIKT